MRTSFIYFALVGAVASSAQAKPAPKAPVPLEEYFKIRGFSSGIGAGIQVSFSHDEKLVAYLSDEGGRADVWVQPIAGGTATQITHVKGLIQRLSFSPADDRLAFTTDVGGDELPHLFLTDSKGTAPRDIAPMQLPGRRTDFVEWADDGKTFLYTSSLRDANYLDLYEYDLATGKSVRLWESSGRLSLAGASRDHARFIIADQLSDQNCNLYLVERGAKDKPPVLLTPHQGDAQFFASDLSRDGKTLYYTSDGGREFLALNAMDLATHVSKPVVQTDWGVEVAGFTHAWKYFYYDVNVGGTHQAVLEDARTMKPVALPTPPTGGSWVPIVSSRTDRYLAVGLQGDGVPITPYVIDLRTRTARRVVDPLPPTLRERQMIVGELVQVPSFDGRKVPAFLYRPGGAGPFPAIIDVHGGPASQSVREFSGIRQYLVSKGYLVLVPNVRGSTGYGKTYTKLDNKDFGGGPLKDVVACKRWLVENASADAGKVVVMGASYGGYMALAAAAFTPNEFAANVDYFGVSDLKALIEGFPSYWAADSEYLYKKFGDPKNPADAKYLHDRSPIHFVDRMVRPLLVVQGERDPRVKKDQSDRIVTGLQKRKVPVHYLLLPDEGHGFSKNENVLAAYRATDRFLDRYIFGDGSIDVIPPRVGPRP